MIKSYENEAAWNAATKSADESTVGLLLDINKPIINAINTKVLYPKYGDCVLLDENGDIVYIDSDSYIDSVIPSTWTKVGVVFNAVADKTWIVPIRNLGSVKWAAVLLRQVGGYTLDGTDQVVTINQYDNSGVATELSFTYNATTKEDLVSQFNTWSETNDPNNRDWYMFIDDFGDVQLCEANYTIYHQHSDSFTGGATLVWTWGAGIPSISTMWDNYGNDILYTTMNAGAIKCWGGRTPTSATTMATRNTQVTKVAFETSEYCSTLREACTDYDDYLEKTGSKIRSNKGVTSWRNSGKQKTYEWIGHTYKTRNGESKPLFLAAEAVSTFGFSQNELLKPGKWYIPDMNELCILMKPITVGNTGITVETYDKVNSSLYKMGGDLISTASSRWSSCRYGTHNMWYYSSKGYSNYSNVYSSSQILPVCGL